MEAIARVGIIRTHDERVMSRICGHERIRCEMRWLEKTRET